MKAACRWTALAALVGGVASACGPSGEHDIARDAERADTSAPVADTAPSPEAVGRARAAADGLGRTLQGRLLAALDSGGPAHAVTYCADSAQALTESQAREGVYVRRVSLRVRNPANRPDATERTMLLRLDSLHRAGTMPGEITRTAQGPGGERLVEYVRPIVVQERCLACHGDPERFAPPIRKVLAARYPADSATGYRVGDLRGMLSVRVRP